MTMLKQYLFRYQGHIGAALVLGGVDPVGGPQLYTVHPHGSVDKLPFVAMGSGSLAAMSVLESQWRPLMTKEQAMALVQAGIEAGIYNDLGSGSNVDLCIIEKSGVDYRRNHHVPPHRPPRTTSFRPALGTTRTIAAEEKTILFDGDQPTPMEIA
jgi:20S proteasome subunit beta 2